MARLGFIEFPTCVYKRISVYRQMNPLTPDAFHIPLPAHSYCVPEPRGPVRDHTAHGAACGGPEPSRDLERIAQSAPPHERERSVTPPRHTQTPPHGQGAAGAEHVPFVPFTKPRVVQQRADDWRKERLALRGGDR